MDDATGRWSAFPSTGAPRRPPIALDASAGDGRVVALGAVCDIAVPWDPVSQSVSLALSEYVDLESGARVVLHSDRGVTMGTPGETLAPSLTEDELRELCLGALLPDEGDEPGEAHPWTWLAELAAQRGIIVRPERLRALPYALVLQPSVRELIRPDPAGEGGARR